MNCIASDKRQKQNFTEGHSKVGLVGSRGRHPRMCDVVIPLPDTSIPGHANIYRI